MNLDELQELWNSGGNQPTAEHRDRLMRQFATRLRRRRRHELAWLVWTFFVLTLLTGFASWQIFGTDKVNVAGEWALVPLLVIPWVFAVVFLKRSLRGALPGHGCDATICESLANAMAANNAQRSKLKIVAVMYVIFLPVLAFSIWQLHSVGKVSSRELMSMATFFGAVLALSAGAVLARYRFGLVPEREKLKALLSQCDQMSAIQPLNDPGMNGEER
jgi:hypothetical protein